MASKPCLTLTPTNARPLNKNPLFPKYAVRKQEFTR